jgi:CheY-like chemotaxis protein
MIRLLYVDNNPEICTLIVSACEKTGNIAVQTLGSGAAALSLLSASCVDVIVSADTLPGMNGITLLRSLRQRGNTTPFILFAANSTDQLKKEAFCNGANGFVSKNSLGKNAISQLMRVLYWATDRQ